MELALYALCLEIWDINKLRRYLGMQQRPLLLICT